ncbi:hypothetical protein K432DRAFT_394019 [Lepidopterella palustris CBS 459.81]|uniref:Uncharacterized protein n=1 Tax=Lepidopterella palustris CBS 459.81 TaxID=1314670 RepID=A0A8E2E8Q4_9PEZI|nr:hypothetical protein K432DRAFT_394019 [Lepidopterella palustris CBS 459.81]
MLWRRGPCGWQHESCKARLPFNTPAASENNPGLYLGCDDIFSSADHCLPRGTLTGYKLTSPGMKPSEDPRNRSPAPVFMGVFDLLRGVSVEYAHKVGGIRNEGALESLRDYDVWTATDDGVE